MLYIAPLLEDGVIEYETKRFHPERIFQMEPSDDVDRAWNSVLGRKLPSISPGMLKSCERSILIGHGLH